MKQIIFNFIIVCFVIIGCKDSKVSSDTTTTSDITSTDPSSTTTNQSVPTPENVVSPTTVNPSPTAPVATTAVPATQPAPQQVAQQPAAKKEPAQNAKGVWHFTCPKGCKGGGGEAGPCKKCGSTLAHNAAYHDVATAPTQATVNGPQANTAPTIAPVTLPQQKVEPPQNANGVWHFTCSKGCAGGAGTAGNCAKCGGALAHNAAYHQ